MTRIELLALLQQEVKGLSSYLVTDDYNNAVDDALRETAWSFTISGVFKEYWIKQRAKRHLFFSLYTESAHKFKYKMINLQNRFSHYDKMIKGLDEAFAKAIEERPDLFTGVEAFKLFGTQIGAGFAYDQIGKYITYRTEQLVDFGPKEND